jgi:hypothetical protein
MADDPVKSSRPVLDPVDRISEVLFGLIMVLTFTGSISVAEAGREDVRTMLIAALGCNLAWGIIDGLLYLMSCLAERARNLRAFRSVRAVADAGQAHELIADAMPPLIASTLETADFEKIRERLKNLPEPPERARLSKKDWLGGLVVFLLVFASTFPVVIPFLVLSKAWLALRISNGIAIGLLFLTGYAFGRVTYRNPKVMGIAMVVFGGLLVALTMALGG